MFIPPVTCNAYGKSTVVVFGRLAGDSFLQFPYPLYNLSQVGIQPVQFFKRIPIPGPADILCGFLILQDQMNHIFRERKKEKSK